MRWIEFPDGSRYTFAVDIQKFAEKFGYVVPCEADGTRHPGTDCNQKMRTIFKDAGMRRTFKLTDQSVIVANAGDGYQNDYLLHWLVRNEIVSSYYVGRGRIQLYSIQAVNALLSYMLKRHAEYEIDDSDDIFKFGMNIIKTGQNLEKKKNKPKASLFKK